MDGFFFYRGGRDILLYPLAASTALAVGVPLAAAAERSE
jgi:hypothetical protein